jgi:hypothetical protein
MIDGCWRGEGVRDSREMIEDDDGVSFESGRSFNSIGLPARTSLAIRLAGDIPVGLAWRVLETVLLLAADDTEAVLRATERTEFAEEPTSVLSRIEGLVCTLRLSTLTRMLLAISLSASTLEVCGWLEMGLRRRPVWRLFGDEYDGGLRRSSVGTSMSTVQGY